MCFMLHGLSKKHSQLKTFDSLYGNWVICLVPYNINEIIWQWQHTITIFPMAYIYIKGPFQLPNVGNAYAASAREHTELNLP